jgi:outer membrane protein assembly factor BamB
MKQSCTTNFLCLLVSFALSTLMSNLSLPAADWSQFLGANAQSSVESSKLPIKWSESKNIKWQVATQGLGWSSPVISAGKIYFTSAVPNGAEQSLMLLCHDVATGKEIFAVEIFQQDSESHGIHSKNSHASPTPIISGDNVFVHFGHQGMACVSFEGDIRWTSREHVYAPVHGNGSSPVLVDDVLIFTCDGAEDPYTLALDAKTGKQVWRTPRGIDVPKKFAFCTPAVIQVGSETQVVSVGSGITQALDPKSGKVLWQVLHEGYSIIPRPLYHKGLVFVSTSYDSPQLLAIDPTGSGDVTNTHVRWTHTRGVSHTPSLIGFNDSVVMVSDGGVASALDAATGNEIWKQRLGGNYSASPLRAGTRVYFQSEEGEAIVLDLSSKSKPKEVARNTLPGRIFASYAVFGDDLIIRTEEGLYRVEGN